MVRGADTKPEWILRCGLHRLGFRYRLGNKDLPGRPDLVFPKYRAVVFVHGCYWHRHPGCKGASTPKSNVAFWTKKFSENVERDLRTTQALTARGWRVRVVWECDLLRNTVEVIQQVSSWLRQEDAAAAEPPSASPTVDRKTLLAIAEDRVRYRIASYEDHQDTDDSVSAEVQQS